MLLPVERYLDSLEVTSRVTGKYNVEPLPSFILVRSKSINLYLFLCNLHATEDNKTVKSFHFSYVGPSSSRYIQSARPSLVALVCDPNTATRDTFFKGTHLRALIYPNLSFDYSYCK